VQPVIAEVVEVYIGAARVTFDHGAWRRGALKNAQESFGVISDASARARRRRVMTDRQSGRPKSGFRLPNRAVPTRTHVAPSSMATSMSLDIPMDSSVIP